MTMYREGTIYVSKATLRRLSWIRMTNPQSSKEVTLDEIAEDLLNGAIESKFPNVLEAEEMYKTSLKDIANVLKNERSPS